MSRNTLETVNNHYDYHLNEDHIDIGGDNYQNLDEKIERLRQKLEKIQTLIDKEALSEDEIKNELQNLENSNALDDLYQNIIARIDQDTDYLDELKEIGTYDNIAGYNLDVWKIGGTRIKWGSQAPQGKGHFKDNLNLAEMKMRPPTKKEILESLCLEGLLPKSLRTLNHELTHSLQSPNKSLSELISTVFLSLKKTFKKQPNREFKEAHAYRAANNDHHHENEQELSEAIKSKKIYDRLDKDKTTQAIEMVDKMMALGIRHQEIGSLINKSEYEPEIIKNKIQEEMEKLGLTEDELDKLVIAHRTQRVITKLEAQHIALEELKKAGAKEKLK